MAYLKKLNRYALLGTIIIALIVFGAIRVVQYRKSPEVLFLADRFESQWIKYDMEFKVNGLRKGKIIHAFKYNFKTLKPIENARLSVQALQLFDLIFDGKEIFRSEKQFEKWKKVYDIPLPPEIAPGSHEIKLIVTSYNTYPAVIAYSDSLPVRTGTHWYASVDTENWKSAIPASLIRQPCASSEFPAAVDALFKIKIYLLIVFLLVFSVSIVGGINSRKIPKFKLLQNGIEPSLVRYLLLFLWSLQSFNNMFKIHFLIGYDIQGHIEYIHYIASNGSLPLATDGWQMFQSPLNYILSAPIYALMKDSYSLPLIVKTLRIIPILCGLMQIEIVYRSSKLVFKQNKNLQIIATVAGTFMPMHTYITQVVGNEPLSGCFISLVLLFCLKILLSDQKEIPVRTYIIMGALWGMALLSKVTAVLLAPVLLVVILNHTITEQRKIKAALIPISLVFGLAVLTSGWFYLRNYIELGKLFIGGWDPLRGIVWWQAPSFRTWSQFLFFGQSLTHPVYAGVRSFGDAVYSTLWLDGFLLGMTNLTPWNINFMVAGALLALGPSVFMVTSLIRVFQKTVVQYQNAITFSVVVIAIFYVAMLDLYIKLPAYSTAKGTYTLGLLPCYAILIAAGIEPFLKNIFTRSIALAVFTCWAFTSYIAYFAVGTQL